MTNTAKPSNKWASILLGLTGILLPILDCASLSANEGARLKRAERAFNILDVNGDGNITPLEFLQQKVHAFAAPDRHEDNFLTRDEVLIAPEQFMAIDRNKDRKVTYMEFIDSRYGQFDAYDYDGNHLIDLQEFVRILVAK